MDVDVRDLEMLESLAEGTTLTAAAQRLYLSQPALSQRLAGLEQRLGTALFERQGRRLYPTPAGRRVLRAVAVVLAELRAAERDLAGLDPRARRTVRLTSQCSTNYQWLVPLAGSLRARQPGAEVRIVAVANDQPLPALLAGDVDVALVTKPDAAMLQVHLVPLFEDERVAVVGRGHSWAGRAYVDAADFASEHLILYEVYDPARVPALPLPLPPGARPARLSTTPVVTQLLIEMVAAGEGVTVLSRWLAEPYLREQAVAAVSLGAQPVKDHWYCATRRDENAAPVPAFAELLAEHFRHRRPPGRD